MQLPGCQSSAKMHYLWAAQSWTHSYIGGSLSRLLSHAVEIFNVCISIMQFHAFYDLTYEDKNNQYDAICSYNWT